MINKNKSQKNGKKKVNEESHELVTNCDQPAEVVANCDHIENDEIIISQSDIEKIIGRRTGIFRVMWLSRI